MLVMMTDVLAENLLELSVMKDEHPVEALPAEGADKPFRLSVRSGGSHRLDDLDALRMEYFVEAGGEFGVAVPDQKPGWTDPIRQHVAEIAGLLGDPLPPRVRRDPAR